MVGTEADANDHWIELYASDQPPLLDEWQRVTCVHFNCSTGKVYVMSIIDHDAPIIADIPKGDYAAMSWGRASGSISTAKAKPQTSPMKSLPYEKTSNGAASSWFLASRAALGGLRMDKCRSERSFR
jgi:hypothetical protein